MVFTKKVIGFSVWVSLFCLETNSAPTEIKESSADSTLKKTGKDKDQEKINALEEAVNNVASIYDKKISPGSSAALNQIAAAFFALGEQYEKISEKQSAPQDASQKSQLFYEKAALYFGQASEGGCKEATYNAGLTYSKLKQYTKAAEFYRQCVHECDTPDQAELALKSGGNLAILIVKKHIENNLEEIEHLLVLGKKYKENKHADVLLETAMIILTDMNSPVSETEEEGPSSAMKPSQAAAQCVRIKMEKQPKSDKNS